jgi:hypothetical protein
LIGVATALSLVAAYWLGYRAGLNDKGPQPRALVVVRRTPDDPNSLGHSYQWFDISDPRDAARMRKEEERMKATKTEYFVAWGVIERSVRPVPDTRRVNSHQ